MTENSDALERVRAVVEQMKADDRAYVNTWGQHLQGSVARCAELIEVALVVERPDLETPCARCGLGFGHLSHGNTGREGDHDYLKPADHARALATRAKENEE